MPYAEREGTKIYWTEQGSGDPLLLIMGLGYTHDMWHRTLPVVSKQFRTIAFDNRGVGRSDCPAGPYTMAAMAADAAAVLDAAGVPDAHVFGISMGGMIAQEFALSRPERVRRLILGCTACGGPRAVRAEADATAVLMNRAQMAPEQAIEATIPFVYDVATPRSRIEEDLEIRRRTMPAPQGYMGQLQAILGWKSYDRLDGITAPTLVIHGANDRLVPPGNGELIAELVRGAEWCLLPEASHIFTTDQPERAHGAVMKFLMAA